MDALKWMEPMVIETVIKTDEMVALLEQLKCDFAAAHTEICKLQKIDPKKLVPVEPTEEMLNKEGLL